MKKKIILFPLLGLLLYVVLSSNQGGPGLISGLERTGVTGTAGCSTGGSCHASSATASTTVVIQLMNGTTPVTTYVPGGSYTFRVTGTNTGSTSLPKFGYQASAVRTSTTINAGTMSVPSVGGHTITVSGINLVEHGPTSITATSGSGGAGTTYVVNIPWVAPAATAGSVTLRGVINAVTGDNAAGPDDLWNFSSLNVSELLSITGTTTLCGGTSTTLSNATTGGGTWSTASGNVTISGTTGSSAVINGLTAGTATISYTAGGNVTTKIVSVNANPVVTGTPIACVGGTTALSATPTGGTWGSGATGIATVSSSGVVSGLAAGTADIVYIAPTGCQSVSIVTVNAIPPITGTMIVCQGNTTTLFNSTSGGTWTSSSSAIASVGASNGIVTGVSSGTATISYTVSTGCIVTTVVTVNTSPTPIGGTLTVCAGGTTSLTNSIIGGTWSSSDGSRATIGGSTGVATGIAAGTSTISYSLPTGCRATAVLTVNATPGPITGTATVCTGVTTTLGNTATGGTWTSSASSIASVDPSTGIVTGATTGTATITYTLAGGCFTTRNVTVTPLPAAISGITSICPSTTSTLSSTPAGGTWSSSNTSAATIGSSSGVVAGLAAGTSSITYTLSAGCTSTTTVTVNPMPSPITGTAAVCVGSSTTLSSAPGGGTWASSSTNASIDAGGVVSGMTPGTSVVTYTLPSGCITTTIVTVNVTPGAISGTGTMCAGLTTTLSNATGGGTWISASTGVASIGLTSGIATGISAGTATISYIMGTGCYNTTVVTVNPLPSAISGSSAMCVASTIALTDGTVGGTWSSGSSTVSVDGASGAVTGVSAGSATVTYKLPTSCQITTLITVNPLPAALTGASTVCVGTNATVIAPTGGGTWASSNTAAATISPAGVMTGIAPGTSLISYTLSTGCMRTITATVNPLPGANSGTAVVCVGSTTTLTNSTPGGSWSSSGVTVATVGATNGIVTGAASGTATITYVLPTGCMSTTVVTVNPLPAAGVISGPATLCASSSASLSSSASGGVWSSSNASIATVSGSGVVSGIAAGTVTISYTVTNSCGTAAATKVMTTTLTASAGTISGPGTVCVDGTSTLASTAGGGTWSSSNTSVATVVASTGVVSGVTPGTVTITYAVTGTCGAAAVTTVMTVNPAASVISGPSAVCQSSSITLSDVGGGTWMSSDVSIATVGSATGIVTGGNAGVAAIRYTLPTGCSTSQAVTVNPLPAPISGMPGVCLSSTTTLTDPTSGGTWTSSNTAVASVGAASGVVTGITTGTTTISYALATGCLVTTGMTVNPIPAPITGVLHACVGTSTTLSSSTTGGAWSSSNLLVATASATSGVITGTAAGTTTITYQLPTGCLRTTALTVDPTPAPITGGSNVCSGRMLTLTDGTTGGLWSSSNASVATVGALSGSVTGVSPGGAIISYTLPTGCASALILSVNSSPAAITGSPSVCTGSATTLASMTPGGTWSSGNTTVAGVVTTSGVVVPVSLGTANISYTIANGCSSIVNITVNPLPAPIVGSFTVCQGATTTLSNSSGGGTWSSSNTSVAVVSLSLGSVLGVATGTSMISYTLPTGCSATTTMTVNPLPGAITGSGSLCTGAASTLSSVDAGGTWTSTNTGVAPIGAFTGIVIGAAIGTATISYTLPTGCSTTLPVTVNVQPAAITGAPIVCASATTTLSNATPGGSWSSSATTIATVGGASGVVTGVAAGSVTITYAMPSGCMVAKAITVNPLPSAGSITGPTNVCGGSTITLTNPVTGGVWSASNGSVTVSGSGVVTGVTAGIDTILYAVTNSCGTAVASYVVTIDALPNAGTISGLLNVCVGGSTTLMTTGTGGSWSMTSAIASVSSGGVVSGLSAGTEVVTYSAGNSCGTAAATATLTITAPANAGAVSGADSVCPGNTVHLSTTGTGGVWASSSTNASVSPTGDVTGVLSGSATVMYIVINSCNVDTAAHTVYVKTIAQCVNSVVSAAINESLSLHPNPSSGTFVMELPTSINSGNITITDVAGRVVLQSTVSEVNNGKVVITMPEVAAGAYMVRLDGEGKSFRQRLVIVR